MVFFSLRLLHETPVCYTKHPFATRNTHLLHSLTRPKFKMKSPTEEEKKEVSELWCWLIQKHSFQRHAASLNPANGQRIGSETHSQVTCQRQISLHLTHLDTSTPRFHSSVISSFWITYIVLREMDENMKRWQGWTIRYSFAGPSRGQHIMRVVQLIKTDP